MPLLKSTAHALISALIQRVGSCPPVSLVKLILKVSTRSTQAVLLMHQVRAALDVTCRGDRARATGLVNVLVTLSTNMMAAIHSPTFHPNIGGTPPRE